MKKRGNSHILYRVRRGRAVSLHEIYMKLPLKLSILSYIVAVSHKQGGEPVVCIGNVSVFIRCFTRLQEKLSTYWDRASYSQRVILFLKLYRIEIPFMQKRLTSSGRPFLFRKNMMYTREAQIEMQKILKWKRNQTSSV